MGDTQEPDASGHPALVVCSTVRYERSVSRVQMIRRGSPATKSAAEAANTTGRTGPMFSAQAIIAPTYQPVADQRTAARARFFMTGVSVADAALPMELSYPLRGADWL
jgi:hypothetical protein